MNDKHMRLQPVRKDDKFNNPHHHKSESILLTTLPLCIQSLFNRKKRKPTHVSSWIVEDPVQPLSMIPTITWIGHASFLIQVGGINILTDPIFGNASFLYPRMLPPGIQIDQLPPIDVVLISHNHHDHMDRASLLALNTLYEEMHILVPLGDKAWFDRRGFKQVQEYTWWEDYFYDVAPDNAIRFIFLPAHHWSQRGFFDKNKSLWGSWLVTWEDYQIYFAGDTAYADHFRHIAREWPSIDVALLPIGPCEPNKWMRHTHMNPQEAIRAFCDLGSRHFVPMHWGTFAFGVDRFTTPIERLNYAWNCIEMPSNRSLHVIKAGQRLSPIG